MQPPLADMLVRHPANTDSTMALSKLACGPVCSLRAVYELGNTTGETAFSCGHGADAAAVSTCCVRAVYERGNTTGETVFLLTRG